MYFNGLLLLSAQFVRIATNDMLVITNGTVFVSAHRVQIATGQQYVKAPFANFVSAHRVQIATWSSRPITDGTTTLSQRTACRSQLAPSSTNTTALLFVSAHRVQIATDAQVILLHQHHLCLSAPRADRNPRRRSAGCIPLALSQRTACRSQRQMCTKHRVRICGMRCKSVDSFSQHEDLLRADYFPELFCYQSSLRCH